jgi:hypothetical protein
MSNAMPFKGSQGQQQSIYSLAQVTDTLMQFVQQIFHCCHCRATASNVQLAHIHHDIKSIDHS